MVRQTSPSHLLRLGILQRCAGICGLVSGCYISSPVELSAYSRGCLFQGFRCVTDYTCISHGDISDILLLKEYAKLLGIPLDTKDKKKDYYLTQIAKILTTNPSIVEPAIPKDGLQAALLLCTCIVLSYYCS